MYGSEFMVWPCVIIVYNSHPSRDPKTVVRATPVTELSFVFLKTCNSWSPKTDSSFINSTDTSFFFPACQYSLLIRSLSQEIQQQPVVYNAHCHTPQFWRPPSHALKNVLFRHSAVAKVPFKINQRKNSRYFVLILIKVYEVLSHNPPIICLPTTSVYSK